jgi:hypothetical protein
MRGARPRDSAAAGKATLRSSAWAAARLGRRDGGGPTGMVGELRVAPGRSSGSGRGGWAASSGGEWRPARRLVETATPRAPAQQLGQGFLTGENGSDGLAPARREKRGSGPRPQGRKAATVEFTGEDDVKATLRTVQRRRQQAAAAADGRYRHWKKMRDRERGDGIGWRIF